MKIHGRVYDGPAEALIVLPYGNDEVITFKASAVLDFSEFERLCPVPKPKQIVSRKDGITYDTESEGYRQALSNHSQKKMDWIVITSLKPTEGLEWETVNYDNPDTWANFKTELRKIFGDYGLNRIINAVMQANLLDDSKIEEARKRFLAGQQAQVNGSSSQITEPLNT